MLSISSRVFKKVENNKPTTQENDKNLQNTNTKGQLVLTNTTFTPKKSQEGVQSAQFNKNTLVSAKYNSTKNLNSFQLPRTNSYNMEVCGSEASTASSGSSECSNFSPQSRSFMQYNPICIKNNAFPTVQQEINHFENGDQAKPKKKTRRGGRKARLRREKEKEREADSEATNNNSEIKHNSPKNQVKYKTELCKNWIETGKCSYSVRCMFAHGHHELTSAQISQKVAPVVKRQPCEKFHNELYCSYGTRCLYIHDNRSLKELPNAQFAKNLLLLEDRMTSPWASTHRLSIFKDLTDRFDYTQDAEEDYSVGSCTKIQTADAKAPINECCSNASDSTDLAGEEDEDFLPILEEVF